MHKLFTVVLILLFASPVPAPLVHAQSVVCPPPVEPSSDVLRVIIGHFGEGSREIEDFCRYLGSQSIMATFLSLGSITDARTAQRAQAALEASTIDALWINSAQLVRLLRESPLVAKIIGVTDFVVVHVVVRDPRLKAAVRLSFHPREAIVAPGRSGYFADALFTALGLAIRCLDVTINCRIAAGEGHYKTFLEDRQGRAAIVAAPTFRRETRDALALVLAQVTAQSRLVAIPLETVARMRPVPGMMAAVSIPRGYYALGARSDVPPEDVPSAAVADMLIVGATSDAAVVQQLAVRLNTALLVTHPRLSSSALQQSLTMVGELTDSLKGRIVLHEEFARQLRNYRLLPKDSPEKEPAKKPRGK